jgi:very-short-patch-repair endonuclease
MSRSPVSRQPKSPASREVCDGGAVEKPGDLKPPITAEVWALEAVRGHGDAELARIAELQRGIIARAQLVGAGLSAGAIKHRLGNGQLHVLFPGVYLWGRPRFEPMAAAMAAVVHLRGRGVLSHRTAANAWGLMDGLELPVELTVVGTDVRARTGLTIHRSRSLSAADVRRCQRLPVTSPARTLLDLAGVLDVHELEAAYAAAHRRGMAGRAELIAAMERAPLVRGVATLRRLVEDGATPTLTRSNYERKLLRLIRRADLPLPRVNTKVHGMEVDLLWPQQRLIVEFDGFAHHSDRQAFERDRLRDQRLTVAGHRVIRVTARQLDHTPEAVIVSHRHSALAVIEPTQSASAGMLMPPDALPGCRLRLSCRDGGRGAADPSHGPFGPQGRRNGAPV